MIAYDVTPVAAVLLRVQESLRKKRKETRKGAGLFFLFLKSEMPPGKILVVALLMAAAVGAAAGGGGKSLMMTLERESDAGLGVSQLRHRDHVRHRRILQQRGVVNFSVEGTYDPYLVGLYFTRVKLGNPPKEFYVQIDTGSDVLWVNCYSCSGCPSSSGLNIELEFFDPSASSTVKTISCSDERCALGEQYSDSGCNDQKHCGYKFLYGDGSETLGFYVSDSLHFNSVVNNSPTSDSSAPVFFGCSTSVSGELTNPERAVDGIFGFGQQGLSVISQLSSQGVTPNAFSHCLKGQNGGGILVLGQIVEPKMVYTPLVPLQTHYNVNLQSIAVNGQTLNIDKSVFETSENRGTIIDSGTTLAYLADEAYGPFVTAVTQAVAQRAQPRQSKDEIQCYSTTSRNPANIFPPVSLNFEGGASMILRPQDYLLQQDSVGDVTIWCIGIHKIDGQGITILGDLILKDKVIVYDLDGQRIGWANYDCSTSVNVSTTSRGKTHLFNEGQVNRGGSVQSELHKIIMKFTLLSFLLHTAFFCVQPFS